MPRPEDLLALRSTDLAPETTDSGTDVTDQALDDKSVKISSDLALRIHNLITVDERGKKVRKVGNASPAMRMADPYFFEAIKTRIQQAVARDSENYDFKEFFVRQGEAELFEMIFNGGDFIDGKTIWDWAPLGFVNNPDLLKEMYSRIDCVVSYLSAKQKKETSAKQEHKELEPADVLKIFTRIVHSGPQASFRNNDDRFSFVSVETFANEILNLLVEQLNKPAKDKVEIAASLMEKIKDVYSNKDTGTITLQNILAALRGLRLLEGSQAGGIR